MPYPKDDKSLETWEHGRLLAISRDPTAWNIYDTTFITVLAEYRNWLGSLPILDWWHIKALAWVESGAGLRHDWQTNPMQIGKFTDPGFRDLMTRGRWILPPAYANTLSLVGVRGNPQQSIEAGIGFLLFLLAHSRRIPEAMSGSALGGITSLHGAETAIRGKGVLMQSRFSSVSPRSANPGKGRTADYRVIKYNQQAHSFIRQTGSQFPLRTVLASWEPFSFEFAARRYNVGDGNYAEKLRFCYGIIAGTIPIPPNASNHDVDPS